MAGDKIASLNYAMRSALPALRAAAAEHGGNDTFVRVLAFADAARWIVDQPVPVASFEWQNLTAGGETALGAGLHALASVLTSAAMPGDQLPPVVVLVSDGLPTDDVDAGIVALEASVHGAKAVRIAVAIGADADMPSLQKFMGVSGLRPLRANSAETLVSSIRWAAAAPVDAVSRIAGAPDEGAVAVTTKLEDGIASHNDADADTNFVW